VSTMPGWGHGEEEPLSASSCLWSEFVPRPVSARSSEGQHPINGVLTLIEEVTGERPEADQQFSVRYTKDSGNELTATEVQTILAHPVTAGPYGLGRFGQSVLLEIFDGADVSSKAAVLSVHGGRPSRRCGTGRST